MRQGTQEIIANIEQYVEARYGIVAFGEGGSAMPDGQPEVIHIAREQLATAIEKAIAEGIEHAFWTARQNVFPARA